MPSPSTYAPTELNDGDLERVVHLFAVEVSHLEAAEPRDHAVRAVLSRLRETAEPYAVELAGRQSAPATVPAAWVPPPREAVLNGAHT